MIGTIKVRFQGQRHRSAYETYLLSVVTLLTVLYSLIQLKNGVHRHDKDLVNLARDRVVYVLEVFRGTCNARDVPVQGNELRSLYGLFGSTLFNICAPQGWFAVTTYRQSLLIFCLFCPTFCFT